MKETLAAWRARTGGSYTPPVAARALREDDELCPVLYRYPGPHALRDALLGGLDRLGPPGQAEVLLAADPRVTGPSGAQFGVIAVLEPLRLSPAELRQRPGVYAAVNAKLDAVVWLPPAAFLSGIPDNLDDLLRPEEAVARLGAGYAEERSRALDAVQGYLEELSQLARAGVPGPKAPWCEVAAEERRRVLQAAGVRARWTLP